MMPRRLILDPRREQPTQRVLSAFVKLVLVIFLLIAIESLFITVPTAYRVFIPLRNSHVHTNLHSR